jgi:type II secretory pathway component PulK
MTRDRLHRCRKRRPASASPGWRRGVVLLIVIVVVVALSLSAYTFSELMLANRHGAKVNGKRIQTRYFVESGVSAIENFLKQDLATQTELGGHFNNPQYFQLQTVLADTDLKSRGGFTVIAPVFDDTGNAVGVRYGLQDESGRLNLNLLSELDQVMSTMSGASSAVAAATGGSSTGGSSGGGSSTGGSFSGGGSTGGSGSSGSSSSTSSGEESDSTSVGRNLLMGLPGMTEDVADAILDWMDSDDEPREYGAERDYYASLNTPYAPRNAPLQTVEELLLVRGVTPQMLFGLDTNRNGLVDQHESTATGNTANSGTVAGAATARAATASTSSNAQSGNIPGLSSSGIPLRGWADYLTLYSAEKNVRSDGSARINLNQDDLQALHDQLVEVFSEEWSDFICAYRLYGPASSSGTAQAEAASDLDLDLTQQAKTKINQVLDLIDAKVTITQAGAQSGAQSGGSQQGGQNTPSRTIASPFTGEVLAMGTYLPSLMEACTAVDAQVIPGRININVASREILLGIPGMSQEIVDRIISSREDQTSTATTGGTSTNNGTTASNSAHDSETWILGEGIVTLEEMKSLMPYVCGRGSVFRAQIIGYFQGGGPASRSEVIFDATGTEPLVLFWRDMSHLGRGFSLETLGIDLMQPM